MGFQRSRKRGFSPLTPGSLPVAPGLANPLPSSTPCEGLCITLHPPKHPKSQQNPSENEEFDGTGLPGMGFVPLVAGARQTCVRRGPKDALGIICPWDLNNVNGKRNHKLAFLNN